MRSIPDAADQLIQIQHEVEPDQAAIATYRRYHALYDSLYPALKDRFKTLASFP